MAQLTAFVAGLLFAAGLGVGGMTQPAKVFGFLDVAGKWDPSLAFVMLGAIAVHATAMRRDPPATAPLFAVRFALPTRQDVDARLVTGAALFGVGMGSGRLLSGSGGDGPRRRRPCRCHLRACDGSGHVGVPRALRAGGAAPAASLREILHTGNASYAARGGASDSQRSE